MSLDAAIYNEARKSRIASEANASKTTRISIPFFLSGTWTVPFDGVLEMRAIGAGGSGAGGNSSTGGYAGAWGMKMLRVVAGDIVTVSIGAGGARTAGAQNGAAGGSTTITLGGVTRTAPGGIGGIYAAGAVPVLPDAPLLPAGDWDFGANSVKPGTVMGSTGGAGVDIFARGGGLTSSGSVGGSCGGGTGGTSTATYGGGATADGLSANGQATPASSPGIYLQAGPDNWIISFYGGSGGNGNNPGGNGGGGGTSGGKGGNGGGSGAGSNGGVASGGFGGGGGGSATSGAGGAGGPGYACVHLYPDMGI